MNDELLAMRNGVGAARQLGGVDIPDGVQVDIQAGSAGSGIVTLHGGAALIPLAHLDFSGFRKKLVSLAQGIIALMAPTRIHEVSSYGLGNVVEGLCEALGMDCAGLGSTTLRMQGGGPGRDSAEPDEAFYIGRVVADYVQAVRDGAGDAFIAKTPPTLVVEVEATHYDENKAAWYLQLGVSEMWELRASCDDPHTQPDLPVIHGFSEDGLSYQPQARSAVLGVTPRQVVEALAAFNNSQVGGRRAFRATMRRLAADAAPHIALESCKLASGHPADAG